MDIVSVQFQNKEKTEYAGREYSYYAAIPLNEGDIVLAPVKGKTTKARVTRVNIKDSELLFNPALLKTINALAFEEDDSCTQKDSAAMNTAIMKNWSVINSGSAYTPSELFQSLLQGEIYEDSRGKFPNGASIVTTAIQGITDFTTHKVVATKRTEYSIFPSDVDPKYEAAYPGAYGRLHMVSDKQEAYPAKANHNGNASL